MIRYRSAPLLAIMLCVSAPVFADQLQWVSKSEAESARERILKDPVLVSYCSCCQKQRVDIWLVRDVVITPTDDKRYYEVRVFSKSLFRSKGEYDEGDDVGPAEYEPVKSRFEDKSDLYGLEAVDLAYVYVPEKGSTYACLGRALKLDCEVPVAAVTLPGKVEQAIAQEKAELSRRKAAGR